MSEFNFNDPLELTEIFRIVPEKQPQFLEEEDEYNTKTTTEKSEAREFAFKHALCWEDIRGIKEYMHADDWKIHKGAKFYLSLRDRHEDILVLGNFMSILQHWREFRNKYPLSRED